jgi:hypothetical protein
MTEINQVATFVVMAFRYGGNEHQFPIGSFTSMENAINAAKEHHSYRGSKYYHRIYRFTSDKWDDNIAGPINAMLCIEEKGGAE